MKRWIITLSVMCLLFPPMLALAGQAEKPIKLVGATDLPKEYSNYRALALFGDKVKAYYGGPLEVEVHPSGALGSQKDYFQYMVQGLSVDFAIVSPSLMATWDKRASIIDPPFLWRDLDHMRKGLNSKIFEPINEELRQKGVRILGYGGGGTRNLILRKPVRRMEDLPSVLMRVMGSPIQSKVFAATGIRPTPMDYLEVYNAINTGVIDGLENEAGSLATMRFYEVAPYVILTRHAITARPICFSEKRFQSFPKGLQDAILKAGAEAAAWHLATESREDEEYLKKMEAEGKIKLIPFDTTEMLRRAQPVLREYAATFGAEAIYKQVIELK